VPPLRDDRTTYDRRPDEMSPTGMARTSSNHLALAPAWDPNYVPRWKQESSVARSSNPRYRGLRPATDCLTAAEQPPPSRPPQHRQGDRQVNLRQTSTSVPTGTGAGQRWRDLDKGDHRAAPERLGCGDHNHRPEANGAPRYFGVRNFFQVSHPESCHATSGGVNERRSGVGTRGRSPIDAMTWPSRRRNRQTPRS